MEKYKIRWYIEGYIVITTTYEVVPPSEYDALDAEYEKYIEQASGDQIHFIFEVAEAVDTADFKKMVDLEFVHSPRAGWFIMVDDVHPVTQFMITLAAKINRSRFKVVKSVEEAVAFLYSVDTTLPDPKQIEEAE